MTPMKKQLKKALEAKGWTVGDAADLLGMTAAQRAVLDLRTDLARAIRERRKALRLSQKSLALKLETSQGRVSLVERADADVSLDQLVKALVLLGGTVTVG
jgi:ribosome-binding protein aMBF1 (putative translation factor)